MEHPEPLHSFCRSLDVWRGGCERDEFHNHIHGYVVAKVVNNLGNAWRIWGRLGVLIDIFLSCELGRKSAGMVIFHEVIWAEGHAGSIVVVPPVCELVFGTSIHDAGLESSLLHCEMIDDILRDAT